MNNPFHSLIPQREGLSNTQKVAPAKTYSFDKEAEDLINQDLNKIDFRAELAEHPFESIELRKSRMKEEIMSGSKLPELETQLISALELIAQSSSKYLDDEKNKELREQFSKFGEIAEHLDFEKISNENLQTIFEINNNMMESIGTIAQAKFAEEDYTSSKALFALLSTLNPNNDDYWYRLGIAAQKCGQYELALKAYDAALEINSKLVGAKLFSIECCLKNNDNKKAQATLIETKKLVETEEINDDYKSFLSQLEQILAA